MRWLGLTAVVLSAAGAAKAAPPPLEAFARAEQVQQVAISADGRRLAILGGAPDRRTVSIATLDQPGLPTIDLGEVETQAIRWAGDYVLATIAAPYSPPNLPNQRYRLQRTMVIDSSGKYASRLLATDEPSKALERQPVVGVAPGPPPTVVVQGVVDVVESVVVGVGSPVLGKAKYPALFKADPATGIGKLSERATLTTLEWGVDRDGEARVRIDDADHGLRRIYLRPKGGREWRIVVDQGDRQPDYLGFSTEWDAAVFRYADNAQQTIMRIGAKSGERATLWSGPAGATVSPIWNEGRGALAALDIETAGVTTPVWFDTSMGSAFQIVARALKGRTVELEGMSSDGERMVLRAGSRDQGPAWYLFDRPGKALSPLGEAYPELHDAVLGRTRYFSTGGGGSGFLTLPPAGGGGKPPLVVVVREAGTESFDYLAQFLATRGYAILAPAIRERSAKAVRGSLVRSIETLQVDILAAIAAAGGEGEVDTSRVCIVGVGGLGGNAALAGITLHPSSFRCAASFGGVADYRLLQGDMFRLYNGRSDALRVMLDDANQNAIDAVSPWRHAADAGGPVLLAHALEDAQVPVRQGQSMRDALRAAGKSVQWIDIANGDQDLVRTESRRKVLAALEAFLASNLTVH